MKEKSNFPWLRDVTNEMTMEACAPAKKFPWVDSENLKKYYPYFIFFLVLALLFFFKRGPEEKTQAESNRYVDVLVVMLATPKDSLLVPETLKQIPVDRKSLSKHQLLQIVRFEDLVKVQSRVRSKKDLPPNKPLFWSDLILQKTSAPALSAVFYSKD